MNNEIQSLLEANLNVILTGAPGTGKTYMAKAVAKAMVGAVVPEDASNEEKNWAKAAEEERIECVQFHPGYDYADFVGGMKPVLLSEDGKEVEMKNGKYVIAGTDTEVAVDGETKVSSRWKDGIFKKFADKAKADPDCNYVFLIDEINRADLSRVFGEVFSLLEKDYRYFRKKDGTEVNAKGVTLPNGENFVIPWNLCIIGTMNGIDRRVESMDFAIRRRFAWYEVTAQQSADIIGKKVSEPTAVNALVNAMQNLNAVIDGDATLKLEDGTETYLRLGTAYQLGGAIFAQYEAYAGGEDPFGKLWRNHIENILEEYLRGQSNRDDLLKELERVYRQSVGSAQA